jgi:hypothetical protein
MRRPPEGEPVIQLAPPLSSVAWSGDFVAQTIETLFIYLASDGAHLLRPVHAETLRLGWGPEGQPGEIVVGAAERYGLRPVLVHSTSWRHKAGRLVLTYVAAVEPPGSRSPYLADEVVERADLARGDAFGPPPEIHVAQVLEHAFRHLAWLVKDDAVVGESLGPWAAFLETYVPEPFRAFGPTG